VREHYVSRSDGDAHSIDDRELIASHVRRITVQSGTIEIQLVSRNPCEDERREHDLSDRAKDRSNLVVPWPTTAPTSVKGILDSSSPTVALSANRDRLLTAIARARAWAQDLIDGRAASFAEIAKREGKVERHIRLLAPLAFVSPRFVSESIDGAVPPDLTVTGLAQGLAYSWTKQECNGPSGS
jgi:site-specific DNA recombinase